MPARDSRWSRISIGVHLLVVALASWQLAQPHAKLVYALWAVISGISLFVLTGLVHEASHFLLSRSRPINEAAGNVVGWLVLTPLSAYRAFHLKHHQTTNEDDDPNAPLNSRWMLAFGSPVYVGLVHLYAWRHLRGKRLIRYLLELAGMVAFLGALAMLPRALRERAWLLPLAIVAALQNIRIVSEHLDLGPGRYHDTWQIVLPAWLSRWLLHYDHHLEHHLRPGLRWFELPAYRAELLSREPRLGLHRVGPYTYLRQVFLKPAGRLERRDGSPRALRPDKVEDGEARPATRARIRADKPDTPRGAPDGSSPRFHGLDGVRGITMILVVALHAALAYAAIPIPNLIWVVRDPAAHPAIDVLCWWTLGISSPFYLMSGFFAAELVRSRGLWQFVKNRGKRIVGPFVAAGVTILPITFFVWVAGWLISGQCTPREILRMKFHARGYQDNLYGPAHLWSLEYLALMLVAYALARGLWGAIRRPSGLADRKADRLRRMMASPWRPLLFALPTTLILWAGHHYLDDRCHDRPVELLRARAVPTAAQLGILRGRGDVAPAPGRPRTPRPLGLDLPDPLRAGLRVPGHAPSARPDAAARGVARTRARGHRGPVHLAHDLRPPGPGPRCVPEFVAGAPLSGGRILLGLSLPPAAGRTAADRPASRPGAGGAQVPHRVHRDHGALPRQLSGHGPLHIPGSCGSTGLGFAGDGPPRHRPAFPRRTPDGSGLGSPRNPDPVA